MQIWRYTFVDTNPARAYSGFSNDLKNSKTSSGFDLEKSSPRFPFICYTHSRHQTHHTHHLPRTSAINRIFPLHSSCSVIPKASAINLFFPKQNLNHIYKFHHPGVPTLQQQPETKHQTHQTEHHIIYHITHLSKKESLVDIRTY